MVGSGSGPQAVAPVEKKRQWQCLFDEFRASYERRGSKEGAEYVVRGQEMTLHHRSGWVWEAYSRKFSKDGKTYVVQINNAAPGIRVFDGKGEPIAFFFTAGFSSCGEGAELKLHKNYCKGNLSEIVSVLSAATTFTITVESP